MAINKDTDPYQRLLAVLSVLDDKISQTMLPASTKDRLHGKNRSLTSDILSAYTKQKGDALAYPGMAASEAKIKQQERLLAMHEDDIAFLDQLIEDALEEQRKVIQERNARQDLLNEEMDKDAARAQEFVEQVAALRPDLAALQSQLDALYSQWNTTWNQIATQLGVGNITMQQRHNIHNRFQQYTQNAAQYIPMARAASWATSNMSETELLAILALRDELGTNVFNEDANIGGAVRDFVSAHSAASKIDELEERVINSAGISVNIAGRDFENIVSFSNKTGGIYADVEHVACLAGYTKENINLLKAYKHSNPTAQVTPTNVQEILAKAQAAMRRYERAQSKVLSRQEAEDHLDQGVPQSTATVPSPAQPTASAQLNTGSAAPTADTPASDAEEAPVAPNASASTPIDDVAPAPQDPAVADGQGVLEHDQEDISEQKALSNDDWDDEDDEDDEVEVPARVADASNRSSESSPRFDQ